MFASLMMVDPLIILHRRVDWFLKYMVRVLETLDLGFELIEERHKGKRGHWCC
jgi:hypothetical protein